MLRNKCSSAAAKTSAAGGERHGRAWASNPSRPARCAAGSSRARTSSRSPPRSRTGAAKSRVSNPGTSPAAGGWARRSPPSASRSADADEPLASLRGRAEAALKQLGQVEARRSKLVESKSKLQRQLETAQDQARDLERRLDAWRGQWAAAVAPLGLAAGVTAEHAGEMVGQSVELQARIKEARDLQVRIAGLRRDAEQFGRDVREVCKRVAPELTPADTPGSPSLEMAASELLRRLRLAGEARTARDALVEQREAQVATARDAEEQLEAADRQLVALCREAQCSTVDDLPRAEERSGQARELQHRLKVLDEQIQELRGHESPDEFRRAALALDLDRLPDRLQHLADEIAGLDSRRGELNQVLGREQQILKQMDGSARAAEAAEMAEELKARLAVDIEEYARLRLAAVVLRESIERYRQRSQGTVLDRAAGVFSRLTLGSFEGLRIDYDDQDQAVLRAIRPGGTEAVGVEGLSLGTADQLYLALRLASLEAYLESHEPVPLIVDDILIQFDDERAAAALEALAEVARRTQVILFTHHEHVCRLAANRCRCQSAHFPSPAGTERYAGLPMGHAGQVTVRPSP